MKIRPVELADAERICAIYNYYVEKTTISFEYTPVSVREMSVRIKEITKEFPFFVAQTKEGGIFGYASAKPFGKTPGYQYSVEISIYVKHDAKAKGVGTLLYNALENDLQEKGIKVMIASIEASNEISLNFHKKMGFSMRGSFPKIGYKFDRFLDVTWLQKSLE